MKIRTQLNILTALIIGGSGLAGYQAYDARRELDQFERAMNEAMETRSILLMIEELP